MIQIAPWAYYTILAVLAGSSLTNIGMGIALLRRKPDGQKIAPSCGCIMCDLKFPRQRAPISGTPFHQTQHGPVPCERG